MTNNTQYPFDLKRALAGEPVITRNGKSVTGLYDSEDGSFFPIETESDTAELCAMCWTEEGYIWGTRSPEEHDLFMLEPANG